jgi:hypothetical protein
LHENVFLENWATGGRIPSLSNCNGISITTRIDSNISTTILFSGSRWWRIVAGKLDFPYVLTTSSMWATTEKEYPLWLRLS